MRQFTAKMVGYRRARDREEGTRGRDVRGMCVDKSS